jgi:Ycf66 protein N-terminus
VSVVKCIAQGWRLDPLLLFGQLLTAGTATAFALEVFRLRESLATKEVNHTAPRQKVPLRRRLSYAGVSFPSMHRQRGVLQGRTEEQGEVGRWQPMQTGSRSLPQPEDQQQFQQWSGMEQQQQPQDSWQATYTGREVRVL